MNVPTVRAWCAGVCLLLLPGAAEAQGRAKTCPAVADDGGDYQLKSFRGRTWRAKINLGPCVPDSDALIVLTAFVEGQIVNHLPSMGSGPNAHELSQTPVFTPSRSLSLSLASKSWEGVFRSDNCQYLLWIYGSRGAVTTLCVSVQGGTVNLWDRIDGEI